MGSSHSLRAGAVTTGPRVHATLAAAAVARLYSTMIHVPAGVPLGVGFEQQSICFENETRWSHTCNHPLVENFDVRGDGGYRVDTVTLTNSSVL